MPNLELDRAQLIEEHSDYLLSFAMSKIRDLELAKDLVQDTFLSALSKLDTFEHRSKVRTWLTSILNRKIIDYWRKAETRYTDPISQFFDSESGGRHWMIDKNNPDINSIERQITQEETIIELQDCLGKLPEKWNGIIRSKYLEEKESDEICNEFDITPSNLWVIIHRAKLLLRDCLQKKYAQ